MEEIELTVGVTVKVTSGFSGSKICQIIGIVDSGGQKLYKLGRIVPRTGLLRRWPRIENHQHWIAASNLEIVAQ